MDSLCSTIPTPDQPRPDMTFTVGERVWVSAEGTDGGDAGYATLIAIRDNGTCDLRDDNGAEYWSLLSHLSRVDQPRPDAAAMTTAREDVIHAVGYWLVSSDPLTPEGLLAALAEAGLGIVPVHSCPHCGVAWTTTVLVDAAVRCPHCAQPDERWAVTLAARQPEGEQP